MQKASNKKLLGSSNFNKVVSTYSIISGSFGAVAIIFSFGGDFLKQPAQIIGMDILFLFAYFFLMQRGFINLNKEQLDVVLKFLLITQSFSITFLGFVYVFSGVIDSFLYLMFRDSVQYGFELTTGGRFSLYYNADETDRTLFGINLITVLLLIGSKFYEK